MFYEFSTSSFCTGRSAFDIGLSIVCRLPAAAGISLISPPQLHSPIPISSGSRLVESPRKGIQVVAQRVTLVQQVVYPSKNFQFPITQGLQPAYPKVDQGIGVLVDGIRIVEGDFFGKLMREIEVNPSPSSYIQSADKVVCRNTRQGIA